MEKYTIEDIRNWLKKYGAPSWLQEHLTEDKLNIAISERDSKKNIQISKEQALPDWAINFYGLNKPKPPRQL
jgi:hypothetical protein